MTHVAICIPSCGTYETGMALSLASLCVYSSSKGIGLSLHNWEMASVTMARNTLVENVLAIEGSPADYLLWIDSDVTFPADGLLRLLAHDKFVVGADYPRRTPPHDFTGRPEIHGSQPQSGLVPFEWIPSGFMLVKSAVYDGSKLKNPWYYETYAGMDGPQTIGEDINFCRDVRTFTAVWCDLDLSREIGHIGRVTFSAGKTS